MEKICKNSHNIFRTLEIKQRLQESFSSRRLDESQYDQWVLWCFSYLSPILLLFLSGSLGNQQPVIMVKISKLAALGRGRMWTPIKVSFPENCHCLIVWGSLEYPTCKAVFINWLRACSVWKAFSPGPFEKISRGDYLISWLREALDNSWDKNKIIKKEKEKHKNA